MDTEHWDWRWTAAVAVVVVVLLFGAALLLGGQTSSILSNVGAAVGTGNEGGDPASEQRDVGAPVDEGKQVADAGPAAGEAATELLIIRTGQLEIEVADIAAAVATARTRVLAVGGYIGASDEAASDDHGSASAVYRIPAGRWDEALDGVRGLASTIRGQHVETAAVTGQVVDLEARITNLRVSETALQGIMAKATRIPDVLAVQTELTTVRGDIERLVAEKALLEERAAYGTLTVVFSLPATPATEEVRRGWDPATDADRATGTLIGLGQAVASSGIWVGIVGLPVAIVGLIVVWLFWRLARFMTRRATVEPDPS